MARIPLMLGHAPTIQASQLDDLEHGIYLLLRAEVEKVPELPQGQAFFIQCFRQQGSANVALQIGYRWYGDPVVVVARSAISSDTWRPWAPLA